MAMIRTGNQYRDSIRDGRRVWINGERVKDVTAHPMFKPIVDIRARIYDMAHDAQYRDVMTYEENGERFAIGLKLPYPSRIGTTSAAPPTQSSKTCMASSPALAMRPSARCGRSTTDRMF
jgi:hypothetical protein